MGYQDRGIKTRERERERERVREKVKIAQSRKSPGAVMISETHHTVGEMTR